MGINIHEIKEYRELNQINDAFLVCINVLNIRLPHNFKALIESHFAARETFEEATEHGNLPGRVYFWLMKKNINALFSRFIEMGERNTILKEAVKLRLSVVMPQLND